MLNPSAQDLETWAALRLGVKVSRAAAALPQTAQEALFNVVGGRVVLLAIIGEVTTVIQTQADNAKLISNPTTGPDADLCANLDITADAVGTLYGISGTFGDAMVGSGGAAPMPARPVVIPEGTIDLNTSANNTGAIKWDLYWFPLDPGAYVEAA